MLDIHSIIIIAQLVKPLVYVLNFCIIDVLYFNVKNKVLINVKEI